MECQRSRASPAGRHTSRPAAKEMQPSGDRRNYRILVCASFSTLLERRKQLNCGFSYLFPGPNSCIADERLGPEAHAEHATEGDIQKRHAHPQAKHVAEATEDQTHDPPA